MTEIIEVLERIATTLDRLAESSDRIETVLEEKQNKTQEAKSCRELMQNICRYYRETNPPYNIQVGSSLSIQRFRDAIAKIKNIRNTRYETRALNKWIRLLQQREFIAKTSDMSIQVLDTGQDWGEL